MTKPLNGVNLGGWLVLEKWMTPSVFKGSKALNEYELSRTDKGKEAIRRHHETFITEKDIIWLKNHHIEIVRVPVGYWVLEGADGYVEAKKQLDWLFKVTKKHKIKILLCLHAAPGAQNNNDHSGSGRPGPVGWYRSNNRRRTRQVLLRLAKYYKNYRHLWGLELLNEPVAMTQKQRRQMWWWVNWTKLRLRLILPKRVKIVYSDCYDPRYWQHRVWGGAVMDMHHYQCFSPLDKKRKKYNEHQLFLEKCDYQYTQLSRTQPYIIGEWSATLPWGVANEIEAKKYISRQLGAFRCAEAQFFWNYKTEADDTWNYRSLVERGYFEDISPLQ